MKDNFIKWLCCLFLLLSASSLVSCDWDDEDEVFSDDYEFSYIGLWDLRKEVVDDHVRTTVYESDHNTDMFIEFKENGDFFIYYSRNLGEGYYDLCYDDHPDNAGYWAISGTRLILRFDSDYEEMWNLQDVSRRSMVMEYLPYEGERMNKRRHWERLDYGRIHFLDE